jgi:hypothetical protein
MFDPAPPRTADTPGVVAREGRAPYGSGLLDAVELAAAAPIDELDEAAIRAELATNETAVRRLEARSAELAAALVRRQAPRRLQRLPRRDRP